MIKIIKIFLKKKHISNKRIEIITIIGLSVITSFRLLTFFKMRLFVAFWNSLLLFECAWLVAMSISPQNKTEFRIFVALKDPSMIHQSPMYIRALQSHLDCGIKWKFTQKYKIMLPFSIYTYLTLQSHVNSVAALYQFARCCFFFFFESWRYLH